MSIVKTSGKGSRINGLVCHGYWDLETMETSEPIWCSDTCGGPVRVVGPEDWKVEAMVWGLVPGGLPGRCMTFEGMDRNGPGWKSDANGAIVSQMELNVPATGNQPQIWHKLIIEGNGQIQTDASLTPEALVVPDIVSGRGRAVKLNGTPVTGCVHTRLIVHNLTVPFEDSDVAGWMQRLEGNYNAALVYRVNLNGIANVPATNTDFTVEVPVGDDDAWTVHWMRVKQRKTVYDHGTRDGQAKIVGMDVVMGWSSINGTRGYIETPDGDKLWPDGECSSSSGED